MRLVSAARTILLSVAISLTITGCSGDNNEMSQEEIQYISHLDQSRFFQRQGELKASTLEARSASELQPERVEPYLIIVNNLITAGDARSAERLLDQLFSDVGEESISQQNLNDASLIRAEARLKQGEHEEALAALEKLKDADRAQQLKGAMLRGDIHLAAGRLDQAEDAYSDARSIDTSAVPPLIGLAKVAYSQNNREEADSYIAQAGELDANHVDLWLLKAQIAQHEEDWANAEQALINALETIGQYDIMTHQKFESMSALINVLREQGKSSEAFVYEEILAKSAPGTIKSNLEAAQEAFNNGDLNNASRYLEEVLAQAPSHEPAALMLGLVRYRQGRPEEAEALLTPVVNMGDSEQATKLLAATRLQMRNPEGAREVLASLEDQESDPETLALVGFASLLSGDTESGTQFIEKSLALAPDNNSLRLRYATYLLRLGHTDRAIEQANRVLENAPDSERARLLVVQANVSANDYEAAKAVASAWIENQPQSVRALVTRGNVAGSAGDYDEARQYYEQALALDTEDPAPLAALGNLAKTRDQIAEAQGYYRRAIMLAPDNRQALQGISSVMEREDLVALMMQVREKHPDAYGPRLLLLESALFDGNTEQADELTASLMEREDVSNPAPAESLVASIYHGIATQLAKRERLDQAAEVLQRGRVLFPNNEEIGIQAAAVQFTKENAKEAREILRDVKKQHPQSGNPFLLEAQYFERRGEYQEAADLYQLALEKERNVEIELAHARALARSGQRDRAIESLGRASQAYPRSPQILMNLAVLHQETDAPEEAIGPYEQLLELTPQNVVALNNLAWIYYQQGDERALDLAKQAYELNSDSAAIADTYGWIMFEAGQHAESLPVLERAHELQPDSEEIAMHLAEAYRASGRGADAKRVLEKFSGPG
ncbi:tetratricopeptide repeat protein [Marinobacter pelagius]|uniref:Putative PEP-CTERM system TPR-repeat lipoprotein n=1 Tax=Marinobacter pelagius TaxID=379482 RepID=A0A1I4SYV1_9GAMM|nr:tetratricopeptide repeat protein [Marinobacter pelagius]SFM69601.1 putative PEP-CTERM system TPR-repeat lipoprotein [Marinobacter pelagius]